MRSRVEAVNEAHHELKDVCALDTQFGKPCNVYIHGKETHTRFISLRLRKGVKVQAERGSR